MVTDFGGFTLGCSEMGDESHMAGPETERA